MNRRVAIQGIKGCFHEQAAYLFYEKEGLPKPEIVECSSFVDLYRQMDAEFIGILNAVRDNKVTPEVLEKLN